MFGKLSLCLLLVASTLSSQALPDGPEKLSYKPIAFQAPRTKDFAFKLKNGIPVYLAADPQAAPFVRVNLMIRGGKQLDPKGKEGLAELMGSQWRAGGTLKNPAAQLDERLEFLAGAIYSGMADTDGILALQVMSKDLQEGLSLFMEVLQEPAFAQERLELAKQQARQGFAARNDDVASVSKSQMGYLLNGEQHFLTADMTADSLNAITREDLQAYHQRLLHPGNFVLAVSGRFEAKAMLDLLNRTIGSLKPAREARLTPKPAAPNHTRKPGIYVVDKDIPQSMVKLALPGLRRTDADWHAVEVMNQILGGAGFSSRLMQKLRSDEGLTYGVGTNVTPGKDWNGDILGGLQTKNRSVPYALRLILEAIEKLKTELVGDAELKAIKDGIVLGYPSEWGNRQAVAYRFASEHLAGWPADWWVDYREKIQAITKDDVQRVARKYLDPTKAVILVVGKAAEAEAGDSKDHPGTLQTVLPLPLTRLPLRDPLTLKPMR